MTTTVAQMSNRQHRAPVRFNDDGLPYLNGVPLREGEIVEQRSGELWFRYEVEKNTRRWLLSLVSYPRHTQTLTPGLFLRRVPVATETAAGR